MEEVQECIDLDAAKKKIRTQDVKTTEQVDFAGLLLSKELLSGLKKAGFEKPSPIQLKAIPLGRCGLDLIVQAKSGTGKTCVFTVVALESLDFDSPSTQVLVLAPTREIAVQIWDVINTLSVGMKGLCCYTFIGGMPVANDKVKLKKCHIAVGTPGRVKQLIEVGALATDCVRLFVLDEADKLMEQGFQESINWIYHSLPENKQMLALSATYPEALAQHLTTYMRNPTFVRLNISDPALLGIRQFYKLVPFHPLLQKAFDEKVKALLDLLEQVSFQQCLIFSNYQLRAQSLSDHLNSKGWPATYIMGSQEQEQRLTAMAKLKQFKCRVLISTDLTSRGIDAENVNLVINMDLPKDRETYMHRIGRAGRFGTYGAAVSFASLGKEMATLKTIEQKAKTVIYPLPDPVPADLAKSSGYVDLEKLVTTERLWSKNSTTTDFTTQPDKTPSKPPAALDVARSEQDSNCDSDGSSNYTESSELPSSTSTSERPASSLLNGSEGPTSSLAKGSEGPFSSFVNGASLSKYDSSNIENGGGHEDCSSIITLGEDDAPPTSDTKVQNLAETEEEEEEGKEESESIPAMIESLAEKVQESFQNVEYLLKDDDADDETEVADAPKSSSDSLSNVAQPHSKLSPCIPPIFSGVKNQGDSTVKESFEECGTQNLQTKAKEAVETQRKSNSSVPFSYNSLLTNHAAVKAALSDINIPKVSRSQPKHYPVMSYENIMDDFKCLRETGKVVPPSNSTNVADAQNSAGNETTYRELIQTVENFMDILKKKTSDDQPELVDAMSDENKEESSDFLKPDKLEFRAMQMHLHPHRAMLDDCFDVPQSEAVTGSKVNFQEFKPTLVDPSSDTSEDWPEQELTKAIPRVIFNRRSNGKDATKHKSKPKSAKTAHIRITDSMHQFPDKTQEEEPNDPVETSYSFRPIKPSSSEKPSRNPIKPSSSEKPSRKIQQKEDSSLGKEYMKRLTACRDASPVDDSSLYEDGTTESESSCNYISDRDSSRPKLDKRERAKIEKSKAKVRTYLDSTWESVDEEADAAYRNDPEYPEDNWYDPGNIAYPQTGSHHQNAEDPYPLYGHSAYPEHSYHNQPGPEHAEYYPNPESYGYRGAEPNYYPADPSHYPHAPGYYPVPHHLWALCAHTLNSMQSLQAQSYMWQSQQLAAYHWQWAQYMQRLNSIHTKQERGKKKHAKH